jgi:ADP-heptose:LPS heptosyltransferase
LAGFSDAVNDGQVDGFLLMCLLTNLPAHLFFSWRAKERIMPKSRNAIDRYTARTRKSGRMDVVDDGAFYQARKAMDGIIRQTSYGVLKAFFHNRPFVGKLNGCKVPSLLVIPYGDAIGDLIAATPIWRAVKRRNPDCRIGVITSERNESLLQADKDVNAHYRFANRRDFSNLSELKRARKDDYEIVLNLHFTNLSDYGFVSNYVGPRAIKVTADHPRRQKYRLLFNHIGLRPRHSTHISIHSLELIAEIVDYFSPLTLSETWPTIIIPKETQLRVNEQIHSRSPDGCDKYTIVHLQAGTDFREWGIENALSVSHLLAERYPNHAIFITAAPKTLSVEAAELPQDVSGQIQYFKTSNDLLELAALIKGASLVITPETSITHFASATKTPAVVLMSNRERIPVEWLPLGNIARILAPSIAGGPVATIPVSDVFDAACSILDGEWTLTQTFLNRDREQEPMFQARCGTRLLSEFQNQRYSSIES